MLVPTELELRALQALGGLPGPEVHIELCGFGPVAAAARTAALVSEHAPARALLLGIAGAFDTARMPLGSAWTFEAVCLDGVGAGQGPGREGPAELGFPQWEGDGNSPAVVDRLELGAIPELPSAELLLTACSASASPFEAAERRSLFPDARAEDMEGFGVAFSCILAHTPFAIVRGISNEVGQRDKSTWRVREALAAARELGLGLLESADG